MTLSTLNLKGNVKITEGDFELTEGDVDVRAGDLTVTAGKIYIAGAEVKTGGLVPDENGNISISGNLTIPSTKYLKIGDIELAIAHDHLSIGGVEIWATSAGQ
jgi:lipopolysaccharide export system protein LptA